MPRLVFKQIFHDNGKIWRGCWYGNARRSVCNGTSLEGEGIILIVRQDSRLMLPLRASRILETAEISHQGQVSLLPNPPLTPASSRNTYTEIYLYPWTKSRQRGMNFLSSGCINIYEIRFDTNRGVIYSWKFSLNSRNIQINFFFSFFFVEKVLTDDNFIRSFSK